MICRNHQRDDNGSGMSLRERTRPGLGITGGVSV
jgi:hypothetical protein